MKKIVPFKKELPFKTNIAEITSISLEHSLHLAENNLITGSFMLTGDYKLTENSSNTESFSFDLPFDITIDDKYILDHITLDIDDFYYEIIDSKALSINIDVLIDKLEEKPLIDKKEEKNLTMEETIEPNEITLNDILEDTEEERCYDEEAEVPFKEIENVTPVNREEDENIKSIFDNFDSNNETFSTYRVYIFRENDTIDMVMQKYGITKENLSQYNDLNDLKIGDKLIIPNIQNAKI